MRKKPEKNNLKEEGFIVACGFISRLAGFIALGLR
jgi:hypothetical protein